MSGRFSIILLVFAVALPASALASDDFPIVGLYTKDAACIGAAARRQDLRVKITRQAIESSMGVCTILNRNRDGSTFNLHIECKIAGDQFILGDVTLKLRDQNTIDFDDQDHTSPAVLYRCAAK